MVVVIPFCSQDLHLVRLLADYLLTFPRQERSQLILAGDTSVSDELRPLAERFALSFRDVTTRALAVPLGRGWPLGANLMFRAVANWLHYDFRVRSPWYYMEPDNTPLAPDFLDALETEYNLSGKRFLGAFEETRYGDQPGEIQVDGHHMVGTGVYPPDFAARSPLLKFAEGQPWDVFLKWEILPDAKETKLVQHNWGTKNYRRQGGDIVCDRVHPVLGRNNPLRPDAKVLHGCKDGSLIKLLLSNTGVAQLAEHPFPKRSVVGSSPTPRATTPDQAGRRIIKKRGKPFQKGRIKRKAIAA